MEYTLTKSTIKALVEEEVSHVADAAYADDGTSLYDSIVLTNKDTTLVERFIDDAMYHFARATQDICSHDSSKLVFNVPDIQSSQSTYVAKAIERYISMYVCTGIFQQRRPSVVPEYASRVQDAMDTAITLLRKRQAPGRTPASSLSEPQVVPETDPQVVPETDPRTETP